MRTMTEKKKRKPGGGRKPAERTRVQITGFRGYPEFNDWFLAFTKHQRLSKASLIEKSLVAYAETVGFDEEAPER